MTRADDPRAGDLFAFYGLLKQGAAGAPSHIDLEGVGTFLGPCWFAGAMYDLGDHPGVVTGDTLCEGMAYELRDPRIVPELDEFEDVYPDDPAGSLYRRIRIPLLRADGNPDGRTAWIYWYNQSIAGGRRILDGCWPLAAGRNKPERIQGDAAL